MYFFLQRLPPEKVTPEALSKTEKRNQLIFDSLKETMNSDEPVWKLQAKVQEMQKKMPRER